MSCNFRKEKCNCNFNLRSFGTFDLSRIHLNGNDRTQLNWNEISIPELMKVPDEKPPIEHLDQIYVDAEITRAKLIETPFAYKVYQRLATTFEVTTITTELQGILALIDIAPIVTAVTAILNIPALPAIPAVTALQAALTAVESAFTVFTTAVNDALTALGGTCILASAVGVLLDAVIASLKVLESALNILITAANALVTATAGIPVVGPAVATAVAALVTLIETLITDILNSITALVASITLIGDTSFFSIIPNEEGTCLTGRKLVIEGSLKQKVVYTGLVDTQSVHSVCLDVPFTAYIIPYANFEGLNYQENIVVQNPDGPACSTMTINGFPYDPNSEIQPVLCEEFCVNAYIEDIFAYAIKDKCIFKNITVFLLAKPSLFC